MFKNSNLLNRYYIQINQLKSQNMKNLILTLFGVLIFKLTIAQENEAYLMQFHYLEVTGDTEEFIKTNKEFYKKLAQKGVAKEKWAGWGMMQSWSEPNKFYSFITSKALSNMQHLISVFLK